MMHGTMHVGVHISLTPITRDSIEEYSNTTCIHCNDMYFDLWNLKNTPEKSEKNLKTIFEKNVADVLTQKKLDKSFLFLILINLKLTLSD